MSGSCVLSTACRARVVLFFCEAGGKSGAQEGEILVSGPVSDVREEVGGGLTVFV